MADHVNPGAAGDAAAAAQALLAPLAGANEAQARPMFPLNDQAFIGFLSKSADAAVMGLLTLNIFSATFLLAWGKEGSICIPGQEKPKLFGFSLISWVKVAIVGVPFAVYPFTVYVSGLVKSDELGRHALGGVAALCLIEFLYVLIIGGVMTVCMSEASWEKVLAVTVALNVLFILLWGYLFKYPECLRTAIRCGCCRQQAVHQPQDQHIPNQQNNNNHVVPPNPQQPPIEENHQNDIV